MLSLILQPISAIDIIGCRFELEICPPRAGHRKGVVEKINHTAAQRWWRTLSDDVSIEQVQAHCDRFATARGDTGLRRSSSGDGRPPSRPSRRENPCGRRHRSRIRCC
jgi:hypothetical protein